MQDDFKQVGNLSAAALHRLADGARRCHEKLEDLTAELPGQGGEIELLKRKLDDLADHLEAAAEKKGGPASVA